MEKDIQKTNGPATNRKIIVLVMIFSFLVSSLAGAFFGFMSGTLSRQIFPNMNIPGTNSGENVQQKIIEDDSAVIDVVEKSAPAVVSILVSKDVPKMQSLDPFDFMDPFGLFGENENGNQGTEKKTIGGGSGFIITSDGMIVTNKHVVEDDSASYTVITTDGKEFSAKVLAKDPLNDIAVVKIEGNGFSVLELGNSNSIRIGQTAIAIGNSLGEFTNTVSKGIISGLKRNVTAGGGFGEAETLRNIIQTDAAINPGNSGGPLLDLSGKVIGVNVAIVQGAQNIGFAIPSNQISKVVEQVKSTGRISQPYIGVRYVPIDNSIQKENNLPFNYGALVLRGERMIDFAVIPGSPADKAGIVENDIILEIDGQKIDGDNGLADLISKYNVGDEIILKIWHRGETKEVKVRLEERK